MKCVEDCAVCCEDVWRTVADKYVNGLMLLPWEAKKLEKLAKKLGLKVDIKPQMGFGTKGRSRPRPKIIGTYQLANRRCPFLRKKKCRIYSQRPLVCKSYPISPMHSIGFVVEGFTIPFIFYGFDWKCPRVKEWQKIFEEKGLKENEEIPVEVLEELELVEEAEAKAEINKYFTKLILKYGNPDWIYDLKTMKWQPAPKPKYIGYTGINGNII